MITESTTEVEYFSRLLNWLTNSDPERLHKIGLFSLDPPDCLMTILAIDKIEQSEGKDYITFGFICYGIPEESIEPIARVLYRYFQGREQILFLIRRELFEAIQDCGGKGQSIPHESIQTGMEAVCFNGEKDSISITPKKVFQLLLEDYQESNPSLFRKCAKGLLGFIRQLLDKVPSPKTQSLTVDDFFMVGPSELDFHIRSDISTIIEKSYQAANKLKNTPDLPESPLMLTIYLGRNGRGYDKKSVASFTQALNELLELRSYFIRVILMRKGDTDISKPKNRQEMQKLVSNSFEVHLMPKKEHLTEKLEENLGLLESSFCFGKELVLAEEENVFYAEDAETLEHLVFSGEEFTLHDINHEDLKRGVCLKQEDNLYRMETITNNSYLSFHDLVTLEIDPINRLTLVKDLIEPSNFSLYRIDLEALRVVDFDRLDSLLNKINAKHLVSSDERSESIIIATDDWQELETDLNEFAVQYSLLIDRRETEL